MKKYHIIFLVTALFVVLFYNESLGLNLGILGLVYTGFTYYLTPKQNRTSTFFTLLVTSVLSSLAFAWYADFPSFLAVFTSLFLLTFKSQNRELKSILVVPVFVINFFTFIVRVFRLDDWLPSRNISGFTQKLISMVVIPLILLIVFFGIYSLGSSHFEHFFDNWEWDINPAYVFLLSILGFFIAFNFFNYSVPKFIYQQNHHLKDDFLQEDKVPKSTWGFMDIDAERTSGVISLFALNILLVFFIFTFNYEQFYEFKKTPDQLSVETHERVNAVIMSIIMAIVVILFYFKNQFNFDKKAGFLKILAKIWIILNAVLVFSAFAKNWEYIQNYGLTYKRLGVIAFLTLSLIGLIYTFIKIQKQKTNAFLFNRMVWFVYGILLICSYINWGGIITAHNSKRSDFAVNFHKFSINFSEKQMLNYAEKTNNTKLKKEILNKVKPEKDKKLLSKILYYQTID